MQHTPPHDPHLSHPPAEAEASSSAGTACRPSKARPSDQGPLEKGPLEKGSLEKGSIDTRSSVVRSEAVQEMAARLREAAHTLQLLPRSSAGSPAGNRSAWPEMLRHSRFAIEKTRRMSLPRPSPQAIDDLDRLAMLMWDLTARQRQLVWARACGVRWAELCLRHRRSRATMNRDYRKALSALVLAERLNGPCQRRRSHSA